MLSKWKTMQHHTSLRVALLVLASLYVSGCANFSLARNFDKKHTPHYAEERKGVLPGWVTGASARTVTGSELSRANVGWAGLLGAYLGAEISAHPEMLVTELQNKGVNAFFIGETLVVGIHTDDVFYPGSTEVRPGAEAKLTTIANLFARYSDQDIIVEGFSDDSFDLLDNIDKAEARASAISAFMWAEGVRPERFRLINHGSPESNVASLATASGLADNRHVVLSTRADPPRIALDWPFQM